MARDPAMQPDMSGLTAVEPRDMLAAPPPMLHYPTDNASYLRSPLPPTQWTQPDSLRQFYRLGNPQNRIAPLPANAQAAIITTATGISTTVVNEAINNIVFPAQTAAVTDGLVHGDPVWEFDSAYLIYRDDFLISQNNAATGLGDLNWTQVSASGGNSRGTGAAPNLGVFDIFPNATTANAGFSIFLAHTTAAIQGNWCNCMQPLLDFPGWKMTWVFCVRRAGGLNNLSSLAFNTTKSSIYIGLGNGWPNSFGTRPPTFFGCRFDTDTTAPSIADTTFVLEACMNPHPTATTTRNNAQGTNGGTFNTGIVPTESVWHRLDVSCIAANLVTITLDGVGTTFSISKASHLLNTSTSIVVGNGVVRFNGTATNGVFSCAPGAPFTISGSGTANGNFVVLQQGNNSNSWEALQGSATASVPASFTWLGYPGLNPFAMYLNDSAGTAPAAGSRALTLDYFSLVWNKGLAGSTTTTATLPRYW